MWKIIFLENIISAATKFLWGISVMAAELHGNSQLPSATLAVCAPAASSLACSNARDCRSTNLFCHPWMPAAKSRAPKSFLLFPWQPCLGCACAALLCDSDISWWRQAQDLSGLVHKSLLFYIWQLLLQICAKPSLLLQLKLKNSLWKILLCGSVPRIFLVITYGFITPK